MNERDEQIVEGLRVVQHDLTRLANYCTSTSLNIETLITSIVANSPGDSGDPDPGPGPDPDPGPGDDFVWPARDVGNLTPWDGAGHYGVQVTDEDWDGEGATISGAKSSIGLIRGSGTLRNAKFCSSGGDGIKVLNGSDGASIEKIHVYGLGWKSGAHADAVQITGGVHNLTIFQLIADVPRNDFSPGHSRVSNAGLIISSQDAPNGRIDVYSSVFYGGNYTIYNISKNSGNAIADLHFYDTDFYVDGISNPQYGIFQCEAAPTFHGVCRVIDRATGQVLSDDPWAWDAAN